jgi:protein TonB
MARRMNIEGVSQVRFAIDAAGQPQGLSLKSSSGSTVLDEEALSTIRRAAPYPAYEEPLEIGIRFKIDE